MSFTTLKINKEFLRAYGRGKSYVEPEVVVYILNNGLDTVRMGITTGKKIGCAVKRNRARRLINAAWRNCYPDADAVGKDIVFVARTRILRKSSTEVEDTLRRVFKSAGILKSL